MTGLSKGLSASLNSLATVGILLSIFSFFFLFDQLLSMSYNIEGTIALTESLLTVQGNDLKNSSSSSIRVDVHTPSKLFLITAIVRKNLPCFMMNPETASTIFNGFVDFLLCFKSSVITCIS